MTGDFVRRNKGGVLLSFFVLFSLTTLTLQVDPYVRGIKTVLWYLISPEVVYSGQFFNKLDSLRGTIFKLFRVEGENYILRQQNSELAKRGIERDALEAENNRLRVLLNLKERQFPDAIAAEVLSRDIRDWFHSVVINKGNQSEVVFSAAVVTGMTDTPALVGRVIEVNPNTSKVLLITDAVSAVSVTVPQRGDIGLLEGKNKPWLALNYLSPESAISPGDDVVTVGLGGVFPPGIPIGKVAQVGLTSDGYFKTARVVPHAGLNSLQEVLILHRSEDETPVLEGSEL